MKILGWRLEAPITIGYVRGRGPSWTWRGWPLRRIRRLRYAEYDPAALPGGNDKDEPAGRE